MLVETYEHSELTRQIIGAAIEIHRHLGPGLLESTYESCLVYELEQLGLVVQRQVALPVVYKELQLPKAYRIDLLVNDQIVVELKAVDNILPVHEAQVLSYLKLSKLKVGLLLNFHVKMMKDGVRRFALK
ncbi:MAG: GxxExxY protein [Ardenticatenaceae bacterium]|nr:GxxExxY protein [Ardenticatenaceae bacterium]